MKWLRRLIFPLVPLALVAGAVVLALSRSDVTPRTARRFAQGMLSDALGQKVLVRRATLAPSGTVTLYDVRVPGEGGRPVFVAERLRVMRPLWPPGSFSWREVKSISLARPRLLVERDARGRLNIEPLLERFRRAAVLRFSGQVLVSDGAVSFQDKAPPHGVRAPMVVKLSAISALLDFGVPREISFSVRARRSSAAAAVHITGTSGPQRVAFTIGATKAHLSQLLPYFVRPQSVNVLSGAADVEAHLQVDRGNARAPQYVAAVRPIGCDVVLPRMREPLRNVSGQLVVQGSGPVGSLRIEGVHLRAGGADVAATGLVADWSHPRLDLNLSVRAASLARALEAAGLGKLPSAVDLGSPGEFRVSLTGPVEDLTVQASGTTRRASIGGLSADQVKASVWYRAGSLLLRDLRAAAAGGTLAGNTWITTARQPSGSQVVFSGRMVSARADALARAAGARIPVSGNATGPIWAKWDRSGLRLVTSAAMSDGRAWQWPVQQLYLDATALAADTKATQINQLVASACGGQWRVSGGVTGKGELDISVAALGVDAAKLAAPLGEKDISGRADGWGRVTGTVEKPAFEGTVEFVNAAVRGEAFDLVSGDVIASPQKVSVNGGAAYRGNAEYLFSGAISGTDWNKRKGTASLSLELRQVPLADAARFAGTRTDVNGMLEGRVSVDGPTDALHAQGNLTLSGVDVAGQWVDSGRVAFHARPGLFELDNFEAVLGSSLIRAKGRVEPKGQAAIEFEAPDLDLTDVEIERLADAGIYLSGKARVSGHVGGTTKEPEVEATLISDSFALAGNAFSDGKCVVKAAGAKITAEASASQGKGQYRFSGTLERESASAHGPTPGPRHAPAQTEAASLAAEPEAGQNSRPKRASFEAGIENGDLSAVRSVLESLAPAAEEDSRLRKAVRNLMRAPRPLNGTLSAQVKASGPTDELAGEARFTISGSTLGEQPLPDLEATLSFAGSRIKIEDARAARDQAYAVASGEVDLDGETAVDIDAYNLSASLLQAWVNSGIALSGTGDASLRVSGPTSSPKLVGSLEVSDFGAGGTKFDRLRATRFEVEQQWVDLGEILLTKGPYYMAISGRVPFQWSPFSVPADQPLLVRAQAKDQDLSLLQALLPSIEQAQGPLNAELVIAGTREKPVLQEGSLQVPRGTIKLKDIGEFDDIKAQVRAKDNLVTAEHSEARYAQGRVSVEPGSTVLVEHFDREHLGENKFDVRLTANRLRVGVGRAARGLADASIHLTNGPDGRALLRGKIAALGGWQVDIARAGGVSTVTPAEFDPALDIALEIQPTAWARSAAAEIGLSGSGRVGGRLSAPQIAASLEGRRGYLLFPAGRFRVTFAASDVTARGRAGEPITTTTDLHVESEGVIAGYQIFLTIAGPVDNPSVTARSIPGLSQQEVNALITSGQPVISGPTGATEAATLGQLARGVLGTGLTAVALRPVERAFAESLGLEDIGFEFKYGGPIRLRAGTYVLRGPLKGKLYLSYLRALAGAASTSATRVTYEILPALSLGVSVDERDILTVEIQRTKRF